jgi:hypothetical protein
MNSTILNTSKVFLFGMSCTFILLTGCSKEPEVLSEINQEFSKTALKASDNITNEEISSLMFMVEEEKLARDVYLDLFDLYGLRIFDNISRSEMRHVSAVSMLIDKYGLTNPITNKPQGEFVNQQLQKLYNDLIELGHVSKTNALQVGVLIEEKDLEDIQHYLDSFVVSPDITRVYSNLLAGSENHLNAFLRNLN